LKKMMRLDKNQDRVQQAANLLEAMAE